MAGKNFWQDKWLHDQYSRRNPGQEHDPDRQPNLSPAPPEPRIEPKVKAKTSKGRVERK